MAREWSLNLENTGGRQGLKDPIGYKQDTLEVQVRSQNNAQTQMDMYEKVSKALTDTNLSFVASRKRGTSPSRPWVSCPCSFSFSG